MTEAEVKRRSLAESIRYAAGALPGEGPVAGLKAGLELLAQQAEVLQAKADAADVTRAQARQEILRERNWQGFWEMQSILVALLHQAGPDGVLITAKTLMTMPVAAEIRELDTGEGRKLWLAPPGP